MHKDYKARVRARKVCKDEENELWLKIYGCEVAGRGEWKSRKEFDSKAGEIMNSGIKGVGFAIAWPHALSKVFTVDQNKEWVFKEYSSYPCSPTKIKLDGKQVIGKDAGCLLELIIAGGEAKLWNESKTIEEYMKKWVEPGVIDYKHSKL